MDIMQPLYRPAWVEINLANLEYNFRQIKKRVKKGVKILTAVKANAYGHGIVEVSRRLERCGADFLGVASVDEAAYLKKNNIRSPILILGALFSPQEIKLALKLKVSISVADLRLAEMLNRYAKTGDKPKIHIKVDTGMGRLGLWHEQAEMAIEKIAALRNIEIEGIWTHFPCADTNLEFSAKQVKDFSFLLEKIKNKAINIPLIHAANSAAVFNLKASHFNMVRPGLMLYGLYPDLRMKKKIKIKQVLTFKTKITYLKEVFPGTGISYGRSFIAGKKTVIATIPVGYADGYNRALSNRGRVIVQGKFAKIAGRVCMDQTMLDVGHINGVRLGDEVILIGTSKDKILRVEEIASLCRTIPYEITCGISLRVKKIFSP